MMNLRFKTTITADVKSCLVPYRRPATGCGIIDVGFPLAYGENLPNISFQADDLPDSRVFIAEGLQRAAVNRMLPTKFQKWATNTA
jgi:hypothetical protein